MASKGNIQIWTYDPYDRLIKHQENLKDVLVFSIVFCENNYLVYGGSDSKVKILEI